MNWGKYICRQYNEDKEGPWRLKSFNIHIVQEVVKPDQPPEPLPKQLLWDHICY